MSDYTLLDALAEDLSIPSRAEDRDAILTAIRAATKTTPFFHAGTVRPHLPTAPFEPPRTCPVNPNRIGAVISNLAKHGVIAQCVGDPARSGNDAQRNAQRLVPWWRVIDREALR